MIALIMKVHDSNHPLTKYKKGSDLMFYWEFRGKLHNFIVSDISTFSISIFMLVPHEGVISSKEALSGGFDWGKDSSKFGQSTIF